MSTPSGERDIFIEVIFLRYGQKDSLHALEHKNEYYFVCRSLGWVAQSHVYAPLDIFQVCTDMLAQPILKHVQILKMMIKLK